MAFEKNELTKLTSSNVTQANSNSTASSNLENARNDAFFSVINNVIDYMKNAIGWLNTTNTWTLANTFNIVADFLGGIKTNLIQSRTTNANINIQPQGTGKLYKGSGTTSNDEILSRGEFGTALDIAVAAAQAAQLAAEAAEDAALATVTVAGVLETVTDITDNYTLDVDDRTVYAMISTDKAVTLYSETGQRIHRIKNSAASTANLTIQVAGSATIDTGNSSAATSIPLYPGQFIYIQCTGETTGVGWLLLE